jgi:chromosome segregation and condensation protein ScpB
MSIPNETIASLEAVLFACGGPVEAERLRELLALSPEELEEAGKTLTDYVKEVYSYRADRVSQAIDSMCGEEE